MSVSKTDGGGSVPGRRSGAAMSKVRRRALPTASPPTVPRPRGLLPAAGVAGALFLFLLAAGCSYLGAERTVAVLLPNPPAAWEETLDNGGCLVAWPDAYGRLESVLLPPGLTRTVITVPKTRWVPVTGQPLLPGGSGTGPLLPAGVVIAPAGVEGEVSLTWIDGAAALMLRKLALCGVPLEGINVQRLVRELRERAEGNPWSVDCERILAGLAAAEMRVDWIVPRRQLLVLLPRALLPAPGLLVSANPLEAAVPVEVTASGEPAIAAHTPGMAVYFHPGDGRRFDLRVGDDGAFDWLSVPADVSPPEE
ncbi:hypothetical protein [Salinispira pacifica]